MRVAVEPLAAHAVADGEVEAVAQAHAQRPVAAEILLPGAAVVALLAAIAGRAHAVEVEPILGEPRDEAAEQAPQQTFRKGRLGRGDEGDQQRRNSEEGSNATHVNGPGPDRIAAA